MKKITIVLLAAVMAISLCCCSQNKKNNEPEVLYETETPNPNNGITKIYRIDKLDPPSEQDYSFDTSAKTKEDVESSVRAVVTAKIIKSDDLAIDYTYNENSTTSYISYVEIQITDVFTDTNNELQKGSKVKIYYINNTHTYVNALPLMKEGEEYFMFLTTMVTPFHEYGKYYIYMPQTLLFKKNENGFYDFSKMLEVFTLEDFGLVEGAVPTLDIMHEFFSNTKSDQ
ncbi:MAG: hypothetical protein DBX47_04445 [Clostridiales bacterium]|nr:MAG: hypothetical protein DBX47_04445 [Clostridiales bacterium]